MPGQAARLSGSGLTSRAGGSGLRAGAGGSGAEYSSYAEDSAYDLLVLATASPARYWTLGVVEEAVVTAYDTLVLATASPARHWPFDEELPA